jgi:IclR family pca regulon transcriptional regulator
MGKVLVAGLAETDERAWMASRLRSSGPNSIVRKRLFRAELERMRQQGYALNNQELVAKMVAIAAPVQNSEISGRCD